MLASEDESRALAALRFSLASDIVELVVLTTDEAFLQTLKEGVGAARRLWHVLSPDKISDLLVAGGVGILVLSQYVEETYATELIASGTERLGYLELDGRRIVIRKPELLQRRAGQSD